MRDLILILVSGVAGWYAHKHRAKIKAKMEAFVKDLDKEEKEEK